MYLNNLKIETQRMIYNFIFGIAIFFLGVAVLLTMMTFVRLEEFALLIPVFIIPLYGAGTGMTIFSQRKKAILMRAQRYNRVFEEDNDGKVSYGKLSTLMGLSEQKVKNDIRWMIDHNFLKNIKYDRKGATVVMKVETSADFITVECPHCGAEVKMRANGGARCSYCGTYMRTE